MAAAASETSGQCVEFQQNKQNVGKESQKKRLLQNLKRAVPGSEGWGGLLSGEMGAGSNKQKSLAFVLHPFLLLKTQSGGKAVADKRVDYVPVNWEHVSLLRDASR